MSLLCFISSYNGIGRARVFLCRPFLGTDACTSTGNQKVDGSTECLSFLENLCVDVQLVTGQLKLDDLLRANEIVSLKDIYEYLVYHELPDLPNKSKQNKWAAADC